jgi:hypothetical protein
MDDREAIARICHEHDEPGDLYDANPAQKAYCYGLADKLLAILALRPTAEAGWRPTNDQLYAMCRAHDAEDSAQRGEPNLWDMRPEEFVGDMMEWGEERRVAMLCAVEAVFPPPGRGDEGTDESKLQKLQIGHSRDPAPTTSAAMSAPPSTGQGDTPDPLDRSHLPPLGHYCPACEAAPRHGYCNLAGCPTAPSATGQGEG